jgi:hypothetical protein
VAWIVGCKERKIKKSKVSVIKKRESLIKNDYVHTSMCPTN